MALRTYKQDVQTSSQPMRYADKCHSYQMHNCLIDTRVFRQQPAKQSIKTMPEMSEKDSFCREQVCTLKDKPFVANILRQYPKEKEK